VDVVGVDHRRTATGLASRCLSRKHLLDGERDLEPQIVAFLETLARDGRGGIVIPTSDDYLIAVARHHGRLSESFVMSVPPWPVLETVIDRGTLYGIARSIGLTTPETFSPGSEAELDAILSTLDFSGHDYVIKTSVADAMADTRTARHTKLAGPTPEGLRERWREIAGRSRSAPTIERIVPGEPEQCIGATLVVDRSLEPVVAFATRRLRLYRYARGGGDQHPYEMGANVYCESVHDPEAIDAATRLVRRLKLYGVSTVEFRRDSVSGALTLIKIDPRVVRATSLSPSLGLDVPAALYRTYALGQPIQPRDYPDRIRWMWVDHYLHAVAQHATWRSVPRDLVALLRTAPRVRALAFLSWRDPLPFLTSLAVLMPLPRRPARWLFGRVSGQTAET
jgi:predicted ATP-grasp superfamily ATP-dependent carboligase